MEKPTSSRLVSKPVIAAVAVIAVVLSSAWWIRHNLYASPFTPTELSQREQQALDVKLDHFQRGVRHDRMHTVPGRSGAGDRDRLEPEPYREDAARREVRITERELNALIAREGEAARRVAVDLSDGMVSVRLLVPMDPDFPVFGGKTLRLNCGIAMGYEEGKPIVALRGVSIGGVPVPNAWLGGIKNVDLVREFGGQGGFWDFFSQGVEDLRVADGCFVIRLRE